MKANVILVLLAATLGIQATLFLRQAGLPWQGKPPEDDYFAVPADVRVAIDGLPFVGSIDSPLVLLEFADFECPYCQQHARTVMRELASAYVTPGALRYVFANLPLGIHRNAVPMARAAICVGEQGRYWEMHERLFNILTPNLVTDRDLEQLAADLAPDRTAFGDCYRSTETERRIASDVHQAQKLGITSTPTFVLGYATREYELVPAAVIRGSKPFAVFEEVIQVVQSAQR